MIDIRRETLLTLQEAASRFPGRVAGKSLSYETLRRWSGDGIRGRRLETVPFGGGRRTSLEALERFVLSLSRDERDAESGIDQSRHQRQSSQAARQSLKAEFGI